MTGLGVDLDDWPDADDLPELHEQAYHVNRHRHVPGGCRWCGEPKRGHPLNKWTPVVDENHAWTAPTLGQVKARMLARRAARKAVSV